jgi:ABC-type amino acid transport substrate-binding protein
MKVRAYLFVLLVPLLFGNCGNNGDLPKWKSSGQLIVGTDATYPPFEMVNTASGLPEGFDIDIMSAICRINGWKPEFIVTPFDGIISGLKSKKYDVVISAMTITPQREAIVAFTQPYYLAGQIVAVPIDDSLIKSIDDLKGRKVGVQLGTTGERMAKSITGLSVFSFDNIGAAFIDMENGQVDAVLNDFPTTMEYIRLKGKAKTVGELLSNEYYGIALRKDDSELLLKVDSALQIIKSSGEYDKIYQKYFPTADSVYIPFPDK